MKEAFKPVKLENYIKSHVKLNPSDDQEELRINLLDSLNDFKNGDHCNCGNPIWVIGSAIVGNACFTCITGEAVPDNDPEIEEACCT